MSNWCAQAHWDSKDSSHSAPNSDLVDVTEKLARVERPFASAVLIQTNRRVGDGVVGDDESCGSVHTVRPAMYVRIEPHLFEQPTSGSMNAP